MIDEINILSFPSLSCVNETINTHKLLKTSSFRNYAFDVNSPLTKRDSHDQQRTLDTVPISPQQRVPMEPQCDTHNKSPAVEGGRHAYPVKIKIVTCSSLYTIKMCVTHVRAGARVRYGKSIFFSTC